MTLWDIRQEACFVYTLGVFPSVSIQSNSAVVVRFSICTNEFFADIMLSIDILLRPFAEWQ